MDNLPEMMIWIADDGRVLHANKASLAFYGYDPDTFTQLTKRLVFPVNSFPLQKKPGLLFPLVPGWLMKSAAKTTIGCN